MRLITQQIKIKIKKKNNNNNINTIQHVITMDNGRVERNYLIISWMVEERQENLE